MLFVALLIVFVLVVVVVVTIAAVVGDGHGAIAEQRAYDTRRPLP